jgi:hypothetical protein
MKFERNFTAERAWEEVVQSTTTYFVSQGFALTANQADILVFVRGSQLSNFYTFNPLNIQSKTHIQFGNTGTGVIVKAIFDINTIGQAITHKDETIWQSFVNNYERSVITGQDFSSETKQMLQQGKKANLKYFGWALLGGILAGVPAGFIARWIGVGSIASMGAAMGAIGLMYYKINQDKEKAKNGL